MILRTIGAIAAFTLCSSLAVAEPAVPKAVSATVERLLDGSNTAITASPVEDFYEVMVDMMVFYISADGRYLLRGDILDLNDGNRNLTDERKGGMRVKALSDVGEESMVVYAPKEAKHTVTVFTDIDCPYCVKFHREVPKLVDGGVKVRYLAFPRAGIGSNSYQKAVNVWCSEDQQKAMTDAKNGKRLPDKECENPVSDHYNLAGRFGIRGTPTLLLEDGAIVPGYVPARQLLHQLNTGNM